MRKIWFTLLALAVCLSLSGTAMAKGGNKGNKGGGHGKSAAHSEHGSKDKAKSKHHDDDDDRGPNQRPHGWDEGKKTGWGDCDVPPGQAKKQGCDDAQHGKSKAKSKSKSKGGTTVSSTTTTRTTVARSTVRPAAKTGTATTKTTTVRTTTARRTGGMTDRTKVTAEKVTK